ncbi:MAG: hypothetical protein QNJ30_05415 [Kiloniellales bacterium]|nr:hypothetical protein [Kiloniellales bacterium]
MAGSGTADSLGAFVPRGGVGAWCLSALLSLSFLLGPAAASDWISRLQPPAEAYFWLAGEAVVLRLPQDLPAGTLDRLSLELDGEAVDASLERQGETVALRLEVPPAPGSHALRLVEALEGGGRAERGRWRIEVRDAAVPTDRGQDEAASRMAGLLDETQDDRTVEVVTGEGHATLKDERWEAGVEAQSAGDEAAEEYLMQLRFRDREIASEAKVGRHDLGAQGLVVEDAARPGASLSLETSDSRARVTGFALSEAAQLSDDPADRTEGPDRQVQGSHLALRPIEALKDNLAITGTYARGQVREGAAADATESGNAWSLATDTRWLDERLRLRGEVAGSRHDPDGPAGAQAPVAGAAYAGQVGITVLKDRTVAEAPLTWDLGLEAERLGQGFASLANPDAEANRQTTALTSRLTWDDYALEAKAGQRIDNVEALAALPVERTRDVELSGRYAPTTGPGEAPLPAWLGRPTVGLSFGVEDSRQDAPPEGSAGPSASRRVDSTLSLGSDYGAWGWDLSQSLGSASDQAEGERVTYGTGLGARVALGRRLELAPKARWSQEQARTSEATVEESWEVGVKAEVVLLPDTLSSSLDYAYGYDWDPASTAVTRALGGELLWRFLEAKQARPAMALSLGGSVEDRWDLGVAEDRSRDYQVFLNLKVSLPDGP